MKDSDLDILYTVWTMRFLNHIDTYIGDRYNTTSFVESRIRAYEAAEREGLVEFQDIKKKTGHVSVRKVVITSKGKEILKKYKDFKNL